MEKKDIDSYLLAKRQVNVSKVIFVLCILVLLVNIIVRALGMSNFYFEVVVIGLFIGGLVNADGRSRKNAVSKAELLNIIERQINRDPEAIEYLNGKIGS